MKKGNAFIALFLFIFIPIITMLVLTCAALAESPTPADTESMFFGMNDDLIIDAFVERGEETEANFEIAKELIPETGASFVTWIDSSFAPDNGSEEMSIDIEAEDDENGRNFLMKIFAPEELLPGEYHFYMKTGSENSYIDFVLRVILQ